MNFALSPALGKYDEWKYEWEPAYLEATKDFVFRNTFADLEKILRIFRENGTKPEFEAYDVEHFHNAHHFFLEAAIQSHVLVQFVMGILGGITATIPHLLHLNKTAGELFRDDLIFSTIAAGRNEFALCTTSLLLGGERVGLEDNLWLDQGVMATNNGELVEKMVRIAREFDLEPAPGRTKPGRFSGLRVRISSTYEQTPVTFRETAGNVVGLRVYAPRQDMYRQGVRGAKRTSRGSGQEAGSLTGL